MPCLPKVSKRSGKKYSELKGELSPLDLLIFRGPDFISDAIRYFQTLQLEENKWSHVGLVISTDILQVKGMKPGRLYIWESTQGGTNTVDVESRKSKYGVQIRDLETVINEYDSDPNTQIGWCKLINNPYTQSVINSDQKCLKCIQKIMQNLFDQYGHRFYDYNLLTLFSAVFPCCRKYKIKTKLDKGWIFCSELVAIVYKAFGLLDKDIDPELVVPVDFLGIDQDKDIPTNLVKLPPVIITGEPES